LELERHGERFNVNVRGSFSMIKHKYFEISNADIDNNFGLFRSLARNNIYSSDGVFEQTWNYPNDTIPNKVYMSVAFIGEEPLAVAMVNKKVYYGWEFTNYDIKKTDGMFGVFVHPLHRLRGLGEYTTNHLFKNSNLRQVSLVGGTAERIVKNVTPVMKYIRADVFSSILA